MSLIAPIEAILFVASKPLTFKTIAQALQKNIEDVQETIDNLVLKYNREDSGIHIIIFEDTVQMMTNSHCKEYIDNFVKEEISEELTKAQLETLTIIAYRGPINRPEIEHIRGVNCAVIIRNLLMRGLIVEQEGKTDLVPVYTISLEAMASLGLTSIDQLKEYGTLHQHDYIEQLLDTNRST